MTLEITTKVGKLSAETYDCAFAKGLNILLNDEIIISIDVLETTGKMSLNIKPPIESDEVLED